jgi:hypothetical protein
MAMRPARTLLGTALVLALAWPAQAAPFRATVLTNGAEVRCKPGTEPAVYVTQQLPRGAAVEVVEKLPDGWLKIDPPDGSFSWVNMRFLRQTDRVRDVWVVTAPEGPVPALVGSSARKDRPEVVGTTLARGTQVIAVGPPLAQTDGYWLPILAPPGEYRYIREQDVFAATSPSAAPTTTTAARPGAAATAGELQPVAATAALPPQTREVHVGGPAAPAGGIDPLLQQAQQLEKSGDRLGAARLYDQLGNKYFQSNHEAAVQYYTHAGWLRGAPAAGKAALANEGEALYQQARQAEQGSDWPEAIRCYTRLGDLYRDGDYKLSLQYYNRANWLRQHHPTPTSAPSPPVTGAALPPSSVVQSRAASVQMAGPGRLTRSAYFIDGRPTYILESAQAQGLAYLAPEAGVDLERYVGQNVEVLGQFVPRSDVRGQFMRVVRVMPLPAPQ